MHEGGLTFREVLLSAGNIGLKGIDLSLAACCGCEPAANYNREVEPFISFVPSILFGVLALGLSAWLALQLKPALTQAPFVMLELVDLPDLCRLVPDHQPP